jgi:hypothetical protein
MPPWSEKHFMLWKSWFLFFLKLRSHMVPNVHIWPIFSIAHIIKPYNLNTMTQCRAPLRRGIWPGSALSYPPRATHARPVPTAASASSCSKRRASNSIGNDAEQQPPARQRWMTGSSRCAAPGQQMRGWQAAALPSMSPEVHYDNRNRWFTLSKVQTNNRL